MSAPPTQQPGVGAGASFSDDPRVSFDRISGRWQCEPLADSDDPLLEWDPETNRWQPVLEDELLRAQQALYGLDPQQQDAQREKEAENEKRKEAKSQQRKKRKLDGSNGGGAAEGRSKLAPGVNLGQAANKSSTSVYVSGLPLDATVEEVAQVFGRYGVLLEDEPGKPRIKFYHSAVTRPSNGSSSSEMAQGETQSGEGEQQQQREEIFKGEALVTFFKPESVELAISILDESCLRASLGQSTPVMRVARADFSAGKKQKHQQYEEQPVPTLLPAPRGDAQADSDREPKTVPGSSASADAKATASSSSAAATAPASRKQLSEEEKKRIQKRNARLNEKLNDWDSDEDSPFATATMKNAPVSKVSFAAAAAPLDGSIAANGRVVILKHMFTLSELASDPTLLLDLKEDVRQECQRVTDGGVVTNVVLWDQEEEGVMTVRFRQSDDARRCVEKMHGRWFAERRVEASLAVGKPKFRRSGLGNEVLEVEERDRAFGDWLEQAGS